MSSLFSFPFIGRCFNLDFSLQQFDSICEIARPCYQQWGFYES